MPGCPSVPYYHTLKAGLFLFNHGSQRRCWHESETVSVDLPMHGWAFLYFMKISLAWLQDRCLWQPHPTGQGSLGSSKCPGMQVLCC